MMLFNELGQHFGLMSGGCLERHLCQQAVSAINHQRSALLSYDLDMPEDSYPADAGSRQNNENQHWQLSIGCGGSVRIFIAPLSAANHYLHFTKANQALADKQACELTLHIEHHQAAGDINSSCLMRGSQAPRINNWASYALQKQTAQLGIGQQLNIGLYPAIQFLICGAGIDSIPLANMAAEMGWQVSINETRSQFQKANRFLPTAKTTDIDYQQMHDAPVITNADCIIIMHHNTELDAAALLAAHSSNASYIGVLGPEKRLNKLLALAGLTHGDFNGRLHGPCGLGLGGDNPASVALSIISHCHAIIAGASMKSLPI